MFGWHRNKPAAETDRLALNSALKPLVDAILVLQNDIVAIRLEMQAIRGKVGVTIRERKKAEMPAALARDLALIKAQGFDIVAGTEPDGGNDGPDSG